MLQVFSILFTILILLLSVSLATAMTLVLPLQKRFKITDYPNNDVSIRIIRQTHIRDIIPNQRMSWCCSATEPTPS